MEPTGYHVQAILDAFAILDLLAERGPLGPTEIGAELGAPKNRTFRHCRTLCAIGQLEELPDGRYRLAPRSVRVLGDVALEAAERETDAAISAADERLIAFRQEANGCA